MQNLSLNLVAQLTSETTFDIYLDEDLAQDKYNRTPPQTLTDSIRLWFLTTKLNAFSQANSPSALISFN